MAAPSEYATDPGFACLGFDLSTPQYFQYEYEATSSGFAATARGDLNGDGKLSRFVLRGTIQGAHLILSPTIEETNPDE